MAAAMAVNVLSTISSPLNAIALAFCPPQPLDSLSVLFLDSAVMTQPDILDRDTTSPLAPGSGSWSGYCL